MSAMSIKSFTPSPQQSWSTVYSGAAFPGTYSYTVSAGVGRMLIVAVSSSLSASPGATQTATVTYGGQSLTLQVGDGATSSITHTYLFYLKDTPSVMDGAAHNLVVTVTGGTTRWNYVYATVYAGVDQSGSPITSSQNYNSLATQAAAVGPFATPLTVGNGDQAVEIINLTRTANPGPHDHHLGCQLGLRGRSKQFRRIYLCLRRLGQHGWHNYFPAYRERRRL